MRKPKAMAAATERATMDHDPVVQGILKAISLKRLRPGMKLGEVELASAFGPTGPISARFCRIWALGTS